MLLVIVVCTFYDIYDLASTSYRKALQKENKFKYNRTSILQLRPQCVLDTTWAPPNKGNQGSKWNIEGQLNWFSREAKYLGPKTIWCLY